LGILGFLFNKKFSFLKKTKIFRFALNRIAHFYRCANARLPRELSTILSRLDNNTLIFKKEKEERKL